MPTWQAQMIAADSEFGGAPLLRTEFDTLPEHGEVVSATLHLTALGVCEAWINGSPVSSDVLAPGWSSYEWRLRYRSIDVTGLVEPTIAITIGLGNGWYRGQLTWHALREVYGTELAALAQLDIVYADGHTQVVATDASWVSAPSPTLQNDLYDGQTIDARRRDRSMSRPGHDTSGWAGTHRLDYDFSRLTPQLTPPVTRHESLPPIRIWTSPAGKTLLDFGQNIVGWVRLELTGPEGHAITVRHAEVIENEELGTRPLRHARACDRYILSGGTDIFEPTFTFHGFRYAQIEGWPHDSIEPAAVTAVVVGSDIRRTGHFSCSNTDLNQLHENVVWSQRGNFLSIPSDCPQRDERLGWTGDIAVFAPSAAFLFDVSDFLRDWLGDLAAEQSHRDDIVPFVVPDVLKYSGGATDLPASDTTAIWSDAAVWVPWALWEAYGNPTVLREQFDSIMAHTRRVSRLLSPTGLWDGTEQFGDWLDPDAPPDRPAEAKADPAVIATACAYRTAMLTARIAQVLGHPDEAEEASRLGARVRAAFNEHYVRAGTVASDCTTVYALAIRFGLLDPDDRAAAGNRLAELVAERGYQVSTGFAGTPFITDALTDTGHIEQAYRLLLERSCPSWLYPVSMGATTIWERWDSMLPDGSINPGQMTSFNHYALGAVADWMHRVIGGLSPLEPGYRTILISPQPGGDITWAETALQTPHGPAHVRWELTPENQLEVRATVPEGTSAVLRLPGQPDQELTPGEHQVTVTVVPPVPLAAS